VRTSEFILKSKKAEEEMGLEVVGKEREGKREKGRISPGIRLWNKENRI
jgi:hypothetical protein